MICKRGKVLGDIVISPFNKLAWGFFFGRREYSTSMSTPTHIHQHSGDVNTPAGSVPLTLPRRSPRDHVSPSKETTAVLFAADEKQDEDDAAAKEKEKGDANKKNAVL